MTRVLVCGGRSYGDRFQFMCSMDDLVADEGEISCVIHGGCKTGADALAAEWVLRFGGECDEDVFEADWIKHGKAAGPIRNQRMLDEGKPDLVIAFPGGKGTADMVARARKAGVEVVEVGR